MNFFVGHVDKFHKADLIGIGKHYERTAVVSSNPDIDWERTKDNYVLGADSLSFVQRVRERVNSRNNTTGTELRKDAVVVCSVIVTASPDFFKSLSKEEQRRFFETAHEWLSEEFGGSHVCCGGFVHLDESQPHMHWTFTPLTKSDNRLCCKEVVDKLRLKRLQSELPKYLRSCGFDVVRGIENSPRTHIDTKDWKRAEHIKNMEAQEIIDKVNSIPTEQEKSGLLRKPTGRKIIEGEALEELKDLAKAKPSNYLEERRKHAEELRDLRNLKTDNAKQLNKIKELVKEADRQADELTEREANIKEEEKRQKAEGQRLADYRKWLEAQDKSLALHKLEDEIKREAEMLNKREAYLQGLLKAIEEREAKQQEWEEKVKRYYEERRINEVSPSHWEAEAMKTLKAENPKEYQRRITEERRKSLENSQKIEQQKEQQKGKQKSRSL